ncbi:MAG: helix-turn-helix domain-containing protein [Bacteroidota bacterium]
MNYIAIDEEALNRLLDRLKKIERILDCIYEGHIQDRWLTTKEVLEILKVSPKTLQGYRDKRLIPFSQIGNKIYYPLKGIEDFLNQNLIRPIR